MQRFDEPGVRPSAGVSDKRRRPLPFPAGRADVDGYRRRKVSQPHAAARAPARPRAIGTQRATTAHLNKLS